MKKYIKYIFLIIIFIIILIIIIGGGFGNINNDMLINKGKPIVFAHRGYVNSSVENSTTSFLKSDSIGFNAIETDVRSTKDGKLIIFHDNSCKRLLNINRNINELKWQDINKKYLIYKGKATTNTVLSLEMFFQLIDSNEIIYLDIKQVSKSIADSLIVILNKNKQFKNIIVADGNLIFLNYIKKRLPTIKTALEGFNKGKEWLYYIIPVNFKPDYYASFLSEVDKNHIDFFNKHKLINRKIVYGIDKQNINKVYNFGLKNIILDYSPSMGTLDSVILKLNNK